MEPATNKVIDLTWTLGQRIAQARTRAGYERPEDFAPVVGVSPRAIRNWENDVNPPSQPTIRDIARLTGAPLDFLMEVYAPKPRRRNARSDRPGQRSTCTASYLRVADQLLNLPVAA